MPSALDAAIADVVGNDMPEELPKTQLPPHSATLLLTLVSWGFIKAVLIQSLAHTICLDMESLVVEPHDVLRHLASLGTEGTHAGTTRRDMWRWLSRKLEGIPETLDIRVPFKTARVLSRFVMGHMSLPNIMPNILLEGIYRCSPEVFQRMFGVGLKEFWDKVPCECASNRQGCQYNNTWHTLVYCEGGIV